MNFMCGINVACFEKVSAYMLGMNFVRYYPLAGLAFLVLWVLGKNTFQPNRILEAFPKAERIWYEIRYSFSTLIIFAGLGTFSILLANLGLTRIYIGADKYGLWYLPVSFLLLTVWHETWFYWAHRAMHTPTLFKLLHVTHHRSINPSPFAAYAFHPLEAVLEGIYLLLFTMVLPVERSVVIFHTFYAMIMNIWWHSGYEFFPKGFTRGVITKWINTSTHHNLHHSKTHGNYSLYFNFWDRVCGTNRPEYDEYFDEVASRAQRQANELHGRSTGLSANPEEVLSSKT